MGEMGDPMFVAMNSLSAMTCKHRYDDVSAKTPAGMCMVHYGAAKCDIEFACKYCREQQKTNPLWMCYFLDEKICSRRIPFAKQFECTCRFLSKEEIDDPLESWKKFIKEEEEYQRKAGTYDTWVKDVYGDDMKATGARMHAAIVGDASAASDDVDDDDVPPLNITERHRICMKRDVVDCIKALRDPNIPMVSIGPDGELTDIKKGDLGGLVLEDTSRRVRVERITRADLQKIQTVGFEAFNRDLQVMRGDERESMYAPFPPGKQTLAEISKMTSEEAASKNAGYDDLDLVD